MAGLSVANVLLEIAGDPDDGKRALQDMARELALFSREEAEAAAYVDATEAQRELDDLKRELQAVDAKKVSAEVNVRIAKALGDIAVIEKELNELDREDVEVDVDVKRGIAEKLGSLSTQILQIGDDADDVAKKGLSAFVSGLGSAMKETDLFGLSLRTLALAGPMVLAALVALGGSLLAVAASGISAAGGVGALAVAFGSLAVPGIALIAGAVAEFGADSETAGTAAYALAGNLKDVWNSFKEATAGGANEVFQGISDALREVDPLVEDLGPAFTRLGGAVGDAFRDLGKHFSSKEWQSFFVFLTDSLTELTPLFTRSFGAFADILKNLVEASMPFLIEGFRSVAKWLEGVADKTSNVESLSGVIGAMVDSLGAWIDLLGGTADLGAAFVEAFAPFGDEIVGSLAEGAEELAEWIRSAEGSERIQEFFEETGPLASEFAKVLGKMVILLLQIGQFFAPLATALNAALSGILDLAIGLMEWLIDLDRALTLDNVWNAIKTGASAAFDWVKTAATDAVEWVASKASSAGGDAFGWVKTAAGDAFDWVKTAAGNAFDAVVTVLTAPVRFVIGFQQDIAERARGVWDSVKGVISDGIRFVLAFASDVASRARGVWQDVKGVITDGIRFVLSLPGEILGRARDLWGDVKGVIKDGIDFVLTLPGEIVGRARDLWGNVKDVISDGIEFFLSFASGIVQKAKDLWNAINDVLPDITINIDIPKPSLPDIPGLATGVRDLSFGGLHRVGEQGEELMFIPTGADVFNAGETRRILRALADGVAGGVAPAGVAAVPVTVAGGGTHIEKIEVVSPGTGNADPHIAAAQLAAELRSRGNLGAGR